MTRTEPRPSSEAGFTLLEMLVSLVLLAMLMALFPATLRLSRRAWDMTEVLVRESADRAAIDAVGRRINTAVSIFAAASDGELRMALSGREDALSFVSVTAGRHGAGLYWQELSVAGGALVVRTRPFASREKEGAGAKTSDETVRVLLPGVERVSFGFFGQDPEAEAATWTTTWNSSDALPLLVRLEIVRAPGYASVMPAVIEIKTAAP